MLGNPKRKPYRNRKILEACREENGQCLVNLPGCKGFGPTAAAHSNRAEDGKGGGQKADDIFVAKCCHHCHEILDGRKRCEQFDLDKTTLTWYHNRGILRTIRLLIDRGIIK